MASTQKTTSLSVLLVGFLVQTAACDDQSEQGSSDSDPNTDHEFADSTSDHELVLDDSFESVIVEPDHHGELDSVPPAEQDQGDSNGPKLAGCGSRPEAARNSGGNFPNGSTITYRIDDFSGTFEQDFERKLYRAAFQTWANVVDVDFQEVTGEADVAIRWNDVDFFSDPSYVGVAYLESIHFNRLYQFSDDKSGYDLFSVAAHEMGHVLGFHHLSNSKAIMYTYSHAGDHKRLLRREDIDQASSKYARRLDTGKFRDGICSGNFFESNRETVGLARNTDGNLFILGEPGSSLRYPMTERMSNWHPGAASNWSSVAAADLDDDGRDELLALRNFDGALYAYGFVEDNNFRLNAMNDSEGPYSDWIKVVGGNFDASDAAEEAIAVRDYDDGFYMYKKNGLQLDVVASNTDPGPASDWADMVAGDFDNDGQDEIIAMRNFDSGFYLIEYDGTNKLKGIATNTSAAPNSGWIALGAGNLDGEPGDELVAVRELDDGFHIYKFVHEGAGGLQLVSSNTDAAAGSAWIDLTVGDYDDDGVDEIMAVRSLDEGLHMYEMEGSNLVWVAEKLGAGAGSEWRGLTTIHSNSGRDKVAGVRNFDGMVYWYEYRPVFDVIMSIGRH